MYPNVPVLSKDRKLRVDEMTVKIVASLPGNDKKPHVATGLFIRRRGKGNQIAVASGAAFCGCREPRRTTFSRNA